VKNNSSILWVYENITTAYFLPCEKSEGVLMKNISYFLLKKKGRN